jgi:diaminopimelate epimerase
MSGQPFWKLTGSGNDFVFLDARRGLAPEWYAEETVRRLCARGTGVGADGVVYLEAATTGDIGMRYVNSDGSPAALCGNATLCTTRLATTLGAVDPAGFVIEAGDLRIGARLRNGRPEIDFEPVTDVRPVLAAPTVAPGELRLGFALTGVPHVVVHVPDVDRVDVIGRGRTLRLDPALRPAGANVNFVSPGPDGSWRIRTYERGVEGETLACGTGAVASAILLASWGLASSPVRLTTRSGQPVEVRLSREGDSWLPSLAGEGRLVFEGTLRDA